MTEEKREKHRAYMTIWNAANRGKVRASHKQPITDLESSQIYLKSKLVDDNERENVLEKARQGIQKRLAARSDIIIKSKGCKRLRAFRYNAKRKGMTISEYRRTRKIKINPWQIMSAANIIGTYASTNKPN